MTSSKDTLKCNSFYRIVKSLGYPKIGSFNPSNFDFLFRLQGTEKFFDWFLENVGEHCLLSAQEVKQFEEKEAKGQVIWDLKRLETMASLINATPSSAAVPFGGGGAEDLATAADEQTRSPEDVESLEKENELLEKELELLTKSYELRKSQKAKMSEKMSALKSRKSMEEKQKFQHEKKAAEMGNQLKSLNQHLNQSIREFDINFGNDDSLVNKITQSFRQSEARTEAYFENERRLLTEIEELASCKIDIDYLFDEKSDKRELRTSSIFEPRDVKKIETEAAEIKMIADKYVKLMERTMQCKLDFELNSCMLGLLQQENDKKSEFFIFTREQLEQPNGAMHRQYIEEKIGEFEKRSRATDRESEALTQKIGKLIDSISKLKLVSLVDADINKKLIESSLFVERQEKMIKYLSGQRERIQFFNQIQSFKSIEYTELKELLEDLAQKKSLFMSSTATAPGSDTSQSLNVLKPNLSATALSPSSSMLVANKPSSNSTMMMPSMTTASSFSATMANLFASSNTHISVGPNLSLGAGGRPPLPSLVQPTTGLKPATAADQDETPFHHVLNQFLIAALTRLQSAGQLDESKFKLRKPISIDLDDNFENFFHMFNSIHAYSLTDRVASMRSGLKSLESVVESTMDYLYEKDEKDAAVSRFSHNLAKMNVKMPVDMCAPLKRLDEQTAELQELFYLRVFQVYTNLRMQINSNQLEQLKRNLFVQFFTNPQQLEAITNHVNAL